MKKLLVPFFLIFAVPALSMAGIQIPSSGGGSGNGDVTAAGNNTFSGSNTFTSTVTINGSGTPVITDGGNYVMAYSTTEICINISSDTTNGFTSKREPIFKVPTGFTFHFTKTYLHALPAGTTVQGNFEETTSTATGSAGVAIFTVSNASATVGGTANIDGITSFSNPDIASDNWVVWVSPATGAGAGGPNRLIGAIYGLLTKD